MAFWRYGSLFLLLAISFLPCSASSQSRPPDVHFDPTPMDVVEAMLWRAGVTPEDVVYDLGCGDGRFVIMAAKKFGARGVGIDIDPARIKESRENAEFAGVAERTRFIEGDLFQADIREATVVTLYLLNDLNYQLRPKLFRELRPGARVVSYTFDMADWEPDDRFQIRDRFVFYWVIPATVKGEWRLNLPLPGGEAQGLLTIHQKYQKIGGTLTILGQRLPMMNPHLLGDRLTFGIRPRLQGSDVLMTFVGRVIGDRLEGTVESEEEPWRGTIPWKGERIKR
ncbi:MAG: class I SAM-dependent methyltransferase [Desulfobacterota bacterium]|nr:class I SAM-dependent methyltransferase [Thermodesulfobacteriota bacterium]